MQHEHISENRRGVIIRPFADAAWPVQDSGLGHALVISRSGKAPIEAGWHGRDGSRPGEQTIARWIRECPRCNIAVRLAANVVGIDVDNYGGKQGHRTMGRLRRELNSQLPATVWSTSRTDGVSGIRLFRLPKGVSAERWRGVAGPGVEIVTHWNRYVVCAPSIHPEGRRYRWLAQDGSVMDCAPWPKLLRTLPMAWCDYLAGSGTAPGLRSERAEPGGGYAAWLLGHGGGEPCPWTAESGAAALAKVQAARDAGGLHDAAGAAVWLLVRGIAEGHQGVNVPLTGVRAAFLAGLEDGRRRRRGADAVGEWRRLVAGAIDAANGELGGTAPPGECECHETAGLDAAAFAGRGRRHA